MLHHSYGSGHTYRLYWRYTHFHLSKNYEPNSILHAASNLPRHRTSQWSNFWGLNATALTLPILILRKKREKKTIMAIRFKETNLSSNSIQKAIQRANSNSWSMQSLHLINTWIVIRHWHLFQLEPTSKWFCRTPPLLSFRRAPSIQNIMYRNMAQDKNTWLKTTGIDSVHVVIVPAVIIQQVLNHFISPTQDGKIPLWNSPTVD